MAAHARISSPEDREGITDLLRRTLLIDEHLLQPAFQRWKYWDAHPLSSAGRSYVLEGKHGIIGHGCRWPMRILTTSGCCDAFHLVDWAADASRAGAGLQVLRDTCENSAALFSIGGSPTTRRILPALGDHLRRHGARERAPSYRVAGHLSFLTRPLRPIASALRESSFGWRTPGRLLRNSYRAASPPARLSAGYSFEQVTPQGIPKDLWPKPTSATAATARTPELLEHFAGCPILQQPMSFVLTQQGKAIAYFFLVLAGNQVRLADYGPANLAEEAARNLSIAAQLAAKQQYKDAIRISAVTSEAAVRAAWLRSGFRQTYEEEIRALVVEPALNSVSQYRITYLDCDALCL
jgi:hypothetical protein